jgi:hypothetical protein
LVKSPVDAFAVNDDPFVGDIVPLIILVTEEDVFVGKFLTEILGVDDKPLKKKSIDPVKTEESDFPVKLAVKETGTFGKKL